jgi:hypothetical protein
MKAGEFISVGDLDIRYWTASDRKLSLRWAVALEDNKWPDLGVAILPGQGFIVYDGRRLWQVSSNGQEWKVYAGPRAQLKPEVLDVKP